MFVKRHIASAVLRRAEEKGAVIITGARQVGKTTLIEMLKPDITHISFDDLSVLNSAISEPSVFFDLYPPPVFIDEVQYAPEIFRYIKISLDKSKRKGGFYLTGSQSFDLMKNVSESLAGRAGVLKLYGLSLREMRNEAWDTPFLPARDYLYERNKNKTDLSATELWEIIHRGCMPELFTARGYDWQNFYADYVNTYIERDVRNLTQVADEMSFMKFMTVCAAMTGQLVNYASLARDIGISEPTAKRWLSVLKTSGIVYLLKPYSNNEIKRTVKTPKLYFTDTGLAAYLTRWLTPDTLRTGAASGRFFETFVINEILKSCANAGREEDLYFLRSGAGSEIDLIIFRDNTLYPIEIKQNADPGPKDLRHFGILNAVKNITVKDGGVICPAPRLLPIKDGRFIIPVWAV